MSKSSTLKRIHILQRRLSHGAALLQSIADNSADASVELLEAEAFAVCKLCLDTVQEYLETQSSNPSSNALH